MNFQYENYPKKLNLGCGFDIREGYLNVDLNEFHDPDLVADVTDISDLPGSYYEEIVALDILEHIERVKTVRVLMEWNRLLVVGGTLILQIPSLIDLLELLKESRKNISKSMELIQCCFGTQQYNGDYHYTSFTEEIIRFYLAEAGFRVDTLSVRDRWLFDIAAVKTSDVDQVDERKKEQFIEQVTHLYEKLLKRAPDYDGLHYFVGKLLMIEIDIAGIEREIKGSQEYTNLKSRK